MASNGLAVVMCFLCATILATTVAVRETNDDSEVTEDFLNFTKARGNDLSSPNKFYGFSGLKQGDRWCLCASRWKEALDHDVALPIVLSATSEAVLEYVGMDDLLNYAVDIEP